jgi:hypothetical protein
MAFSPPSSPGSPRTCSPPPSDCELPAPASPALCQLPESRRTSGSSLKGKEKAREGPLRLLDLPIDVLKEIVHQVSTSAAP